MFFPHVYFLCLIPMCFPDVSSYAFSYVPCRCVVLCIFPTRFPCVCFLRFLSMRFSMGCPMFFFPMCFSYAFYHTVFQCEFLCVFPIPFSYVCSLCVFRVFFSFLSYAFFRCVLLWCFHMGLPYVFSRRMFTMFVTEVISYVSFLRFFPMRFPIFSSMCCCPMRFPILFSFDVSPYAFSYFVSYVVS